MSIYFVEVEGQVVMDHEIQPLSFQLIQMDQKKLLQLLPKTPVYQLHEENGITGSKRLLPIQRSAKLSTR